MNAQTIVVLEGDETGQELLDEALRVLVPDVTGLELEFPRFDLSLENRRKTGNRIVHDAAAVLREAGLGLKAATITPEGADDVGSPNRVLREEIGGHVIVRTGRRIPGVVPIGGVHHPISVVRMAVGDAYGAHEWREGSGEEEIAFRTERIERRICRAVAEFSFRHAQRTGAKVFGGPKYTVSPVYEGMLKEEMDTASAQHPDVPYDPQLIDATFALLISLAGEPLVIPSPNRHPTLGGGNRLLAQVLTKGAAHRHVLLVGSRLGAGSTVWCECPSAFPPPGHCLARQRGSGTTEETLRDRLVLNVVLSRVRVDKVVDYVPVVEGIVDLHEWLPLLG